jgi:hypothetical protein
MDDLVTRLRTPIKTAPETWFTTMESAADEIERLRAFAEAVVRYAGNAGDDYLANKARAALAGEKAND